VLAAVHYVLVLVLRKHMLGIIRLKHDKVVNDVVFRGPRLDPVLSFTLQGPT
jgi:hypothetical protein